MIVLIGMKPFGTVGTWLSLIKGSMLLHIRTATEYYHVTSRRCPARKKRADALRPGRHLPRAMVEDTNERDFHHPYVPYEIQKQFMGAVYRCLEDGKVGIFESPTGTGKSLSLICGSLTWLRDHKRRTFEEGFAADAANSDEPLWMLEHAQAEKKHQALHRKRELEARVAKIKEKEKRIKQRYEDGDSRAKRQKLASREESHGEDEALFVLDDYESDGEGQKRARLGTFNDCGLSADTQALMESLGLSAGPAKEDCEELDETKIFFCSRTHSQLTQFSSELRRVKMPAAITLEENARRDDGSNDFEDVKHLTLGSRKNLCINSKVNRLGNGTAINERCIELQQNTSSEKRCPHMPTKENEALANEFRDYALAKIRDIEDLGKLGKSLGICPYYASRPAAKYCEVSGRSKLNGFKLMLVADCYLAVSSTAPKNSP